MYFYIFLNIHSIHLNNLLNHYIKIIILLYLIFLLIYLTITYMFNQLIYLKYLQILN
jgi:hypothetical protein